MADALFWILCRSGLWHAWPQGGNSSLCGCVTKEDLRKAPAKQIVRTLPKEALVCKCCTRSRLGRSAAARMLPKGSVAAQWWAYLRRHLITQRVHISTANGRLLAKHLAAVGSPTDTAAVAVYEQIRTLLLTPRPQRVRTRNGHSQMYKVTRLKEALAALPPTAASLQHVANAMQLWRRITGRGVNSKTERYRTDTVVETMLAVSNLEAYIRSQHNLGRSSLAQMFHPSTLTRAAKNPNLRGAMDPKTQAYWDRAKHQLTIVEE